MKGVAFTGTAKIKFLLCHFLTLWLFRLIVPQFPHLSNGGNNDFYSVVCSGEGDYTCIVCLAHSKSSVNVVIIITY